MALFKLDIDTQLQPGKIRFEISPDMQAEILDVLVEFTAQGCTILKTATHSTIIFMVDAPPPVLDAYLDKLKMYMVHALITDNGTTDN